jgi:hypothetical protein
MRQGLRLALAAWGLALCTLAGGQTTAPVLDRSPTWASLSPAQKQALSPLQREWATIEPNRKQKWLEIAGRFPAMPAEERQRLQERMADWTRLTPAQRADARMQFQEVRRVPAEERQARWQAYQALPAEERDKLARQARPVAAAASSPAAKPRATAAASGATNTAPKGNAVVPTVGTSTRPVAPTVVQAKPGATTTSMSTRALPPPHHQPGLPKIAATPGYVDPATLLPKRGPQGAAVRAAASADPAEQP